MESPKFPIDLKDAYNDGYLACPHCFKPFIVPYQYAWGQKPMPLIIHCFHCGNPIKTS